MNRSSKHIVYTKVLSSNSPATSGSMGEILHKANTFFSILKFMVNMNNQRTTPKRSSFLQKVKASRSPDISFESSLDKMLPENLVKSEVQTEHSKETESEPSIHSLLQQATEETEEKTQTTLENEPTLNHDNSKEKTMHIEIPTQEPDQNEEAQKSSREKLKTFAIALPILTGISLGAFWLLKKSGKI